MESPPIVLPIQEINDSIIIKEEISKTNLHKDDNISYNSNIEVKEIKEKPNNM